MMSILYRSACDRKDKSNFHCATQLLTQNSYPVSTVHEQLSYDPPATEIRLRTKVTRCAYMRLSRHPRVVGLLFRTRAPTTISATILTRRACMRHAYAVHKPGFSDLNRCATIVRVGCIIVEHYDRLLKISHNLESSWHVSLKPFTLGHQQ